MRLLMQLYFEFMSGEFSKSFEMPMWKAGNAAAEHTNNWTIELFSQFYARFCRNNDSFHLFIII